MNTFLRPYVVQPLAVLLCLFTLYEVNYGLFSPLSQLAVFAMLGLLLCFLSRPFVLSEGVRDRLERRQGESVRFTVEIVDLLLTLAFIVSTVICCGYIVLEGVDLSNRAGAFTTTDQWIAVLGTVVVLEAARRSVGFALPILAILFLLHAYAGDLLPVDSFLAHRGYDTERIATKAFHGSDGIFGVALRVMFTYVFLFVIFGAFLELSGATQFIIDFAERVFGHSPGGPAKMSVLGSGLMGSLSGSAVANAVTTGSFTIPMMRSAGFSPHISGGIMAAAASGGALVPPVMGAGAYMMLEIVDPPVTFLQIAKAATIPAILYYFSILMFVHLYSHRIGTATLAVREPTEKSEPRPLLQYAGLVFFGALATLILFLLVGYTPFRAVTYSLEVILLLTLFSPDVKVSRGNRIAALTAFVSVTAFVAIFKRFADEWFGSGDDASLIIRKLGELFRPDASAPLSDWMVWADAAIPAMVLVLLLGLFHPVWRPMIREALVKSAQGGISLIAASACVGIIIAMVTLTGVGTSFPNAIIPLAENSLFLALVAIMLCAIVLGMGLPSAVCYLLMATLIGPVLGKLGVIPLAAHLFIFYFGMMSMVTPPVALAAYATASLAESNIMQTGLAAFRFSLVGFTLPFMFVFRPELLLMSDKPDVKEVVAGRPAENQEAMISGTLHRYGETLPERKIEIVSIGANGELKTIASDGFGRFRLRLSPGRHSLTSYSTEGNRRRLGELVYDPDGTPPSDSESTSQAWFDDQRLSVTQTLLALTAAVLGVIALAAGLAGYLRSRMGSLLRALSFAAAALLLYPGEGWPLGDVRIAPTDVAGLVLFVVVLVLNRGNAEKRETPSVLAATPDPGL